MQLTSAGSDWDRIRKAICSGYFHQSARLKGIGEYVNMFTSMPCHLHPSSALYGMGYTPDYVVYNELTMTTKEYMQNVTSVNGEWLAELAPTFFSVKEGGINSTYKKEKQIREELKKAKKELLEEQKQNQDSQKSVSRSKIVDIGTPNVQQPRGPLSTPRRRVGGI